MWIRIDNQDVGSEAATIERVRNSSLVKWICAENSAGLKLGTEATDPGDRFAGHWLVGERSVSSEGRP